MAFFWSNCTRGVLATALALVLGLAVEVAGNLHMPSVRVSPHLRGGQMSRAQKHKLPDEPRIDFDNSMDDGLSFQPSQQLSNRIEKLRRRQVSFVKGFYNAKLGSFNHDGIDVNRVSVSSTSLGIFTIFEDVSLWTGDVVVDKQEAKIKGTNYICLSKIQDALSNPAHADKPCALYWSELHTPGIVHLTALHVTSQTIHVRDGSSLGAFRVPFMALSMMMLQTDASTPKLRSVLNLIMETVAASVGLTVDGDDTLLHGQSQLSMYLLYWNTKALIHALKSKDVHGDPYVTDEVSAFVSILDRTAVVAQDNLCRQLAHHYAGDCAAFDVVQLAYALLLHFETTGEKGAEISGDQVSVPFNTKLAAKALEIVFSKQLQNGLWPQGLPIDRHGESMRGDIGNSFVFTFDLLAGLLGTIAKSRPELFRPYLPQLYRSLAWAEDNIVVDMGTQSEGGNHSPELRGWRSNHLGEGGPVMWCTAQVFLAVSRMGTLVRQLRNSDILKEFGGTCASHADDRNWKKLLDSEVELGGEHFSLKATLEAKVLEPLTESGALDPMDIFSTRNRPATASPKWSVILYGPPGTAKTTICTSIAQKLGWNFLTVDTADFLSAGLQNVASRMTYIFDRLRSLERTVILFDEIEEFCLDRQDKSLTMESRMLTTAMLTQLNDLRRQQKCIFLVATNRLRAFDAAVTRPGRFDMILQVGTPGLDARLERLRGKLRRMGLSDATLPHFDSDKAQVTEVAAADMATAMVSRSYGDYLQFLNYPENEAFTDEVVNLVRNRKLCDETFAKILARQMDTATIQGPVREEYLSGFKLSRC